MADKPQTTQDFRLVSVMIYKAGSDVRVSPVDGKPINMTNLVDTFNYVESITSPCVAATMNIADSAGVLNRLPIQGMETVEVKLVSNPKPEEEQFYRFKLCIKDKK